jgi:hypothetical protein
VRECLGRQTKAAGRSAAAVLHLVIVALAIQYLEANKTFESEESELRSALPIVGNRFETRRGAVNRFLDDVMQADGCLFELDRRTWRAAYAQPYIDPRSKVSV